MVCIACLSSLSFTGRFATFSLESSDSTANDLLPVFYGHIQITVLLRFFYYLCVCSIQDVCWCKKLLVRVKQLGEAIDWLIVSSVSLSIYLTASGGRSAKMRKLVELACIITNYSQCPSMDIHLITHCLNVDYNFVPVQLSLHHIMVATLNKCPTQGGGKEKRWN